MKKKQSPEELKHRIKKLEKEIASQRRFQNISHTLCSISNAVNTTHDLDQLYESIHKALSAIIDTTNFYIALYDSTMDKVTFPYCIDSVDKCYPPVFDIRKTESLTAEVIRKGRPLLVKKAEILKQRRQTRRKLPACTPSEIWLGVPLKSKGRIIGVMAVQSYSNPECYDSTDMEVMISVADQVAMAIERKQAIEALWEAKTRWQALSEASFEAIFLSDRGICLDQNLTAEKMFGYTRQEAIGRPGTDWIIPEDRELVKKNMVLKYAAPYEVTALRKDGVAFPCEIQAREVESLGSSIRITALRDISARKESEAALRESEERFRRIYEHMAVGVARVSIQFIIESANEAYCKMLGYTESELIGKHLKDITHIDSLEENLIQQFRLAAGEIDHFRMEKRFIHKNGNSIYGILDANLVRNSKGRPIYFLGSVLDISEQKRIETRLRQAQKMESIGNLAGGIAHDFNNILFPIVGMSEILLEDMVPGTSEHESVEEILKAGKRGSGLVKQILAFSRQSDHMVVPVLFQQVLKEVLKLVRSTIPSNIEILHDIQNNCGSVLADPTQLHQIAMNLITNAYHAVQETGGNISITLKEKEKVGKGKEGISLAPGPYAVLSVTDTGCGIDPTLMDRIFDPYFTTKETGKGTGLGLAVVYGIVKDYNGDIRVESQKGKGSGFHIYLPIVDEDAAQAVPEPTPQNLAGDEHILLVDDEPAIVRLEKQMLERLGYHVTEHARSPDALKEFAADPFGFDLILTDMTMPGLTGDNLAKNVISIRPDIPVIICTGFSERLDPKKADEMGIKGFLMKPVILSELGRMVRSVLEEKNAVKQN